MRWDVPVLVVKMGEYPLHHGGLWIARSLGRAGVRVFAMTESRATPLAVSRYVTRAGRALDPAASDADNRRNLATALRVIGRPAVAIATDDEAAVWLSENRPDGVILPNVKRGLPRALADKWSLHTLCAEHGIASPPTFVPTTRDQLEALAATLRFPIVLKNSQPFSRVIAPAVQYTMVLDDAAQLRAWAEVNFSEEHPPLVQELTPADVAEKWSYQAYRSRHVMSSFTGLKRRDYPLHRGEATLVESLPNAEVAALGDRFLQSIGYAGMADLDFVLDTRDKVYRLIDFNPRVGAIAAMCGTDDGLDLLRISYLDLTGQHVQPGQQVDQRVFQVEPKDALARQELQIPEGPAATLRAYQADDDRRPAMVVRARSTLAKVKQRITS